MLRLLLSASLLVLAHAAAAQPLATTANPTFAGTLAGSDVEGGLWAVMMEYQKLMNKENREDKKLARDDARLAAKPAGLEAQLEYFIAVADRLMASDHKKDLTQLGAVLDALKQQKREKLPLMQVDIPLQKLLHEIEKLKQQEEAEQDRQKQKAEPHKLQPCQPLPDCMKAHTAATPATTHFPSALTPGLLDGERGFSAQGPATTGTPNAPPPALFRR